MGHNNNGSSLSLWYLGIHKQNYAITKDLTPFYFDLFDFLAKLTGAEVARWATIIGAVIVMDAKYRKDLFQCE